LIPDPFEFPQVLGSRQEFAVDQRRTREFEGARNTSNSLIYGRFIPSLGNRPALGVMRKW